MTNNFTYQVNLVLQKSYRLNHRLPVEHTHEDIDACFGTIASWFDRSFTQTPDAYKMAILAAFDGSKSKLNINVVDVFVVPDYQAFFEPFIDPLFSRTHKMEWTQHQYRFQAVVISNFFPHGSKVTYRKYSSDKVFVIEKKPLFNCTTSVGRLTGNFFYFNNFFYHTHYTPTTHIVYPPTHTTPTTTYIV